MNERQRALELAVTQIEKQFGKGSIMNAFPDVIGGPGRLCRVDKRTFVW